MIRYTLRYANGPEGDAVVEFDAASVEAALQVAKKRARHDWAELHQGDRPICRLQEVDNNVWRVVRLGKGE